MLDCLNLRNVVSKLNLKLFFKGRQFSKVESEAEFVDPSCVELLPV